MNRLKLTIFMLSVLIVAGCSTTANQESLVLSSLDLGQASKFQVAVGVEVIGGMKGLISSELYKSALTDSIEQTRIFRSIDTSKNPQYRLFVIILRFESYSVGHSNVMISKWILQKDDEEIWSDTVTGNGSSNTFVGVTRMRESAERAGKDNILNGLKLIGAIAPDKIPEQVASTSLLTESSESANQIGISGTYVSEITGNTRKLNPGSQNPIVEIVRNGNEISGTFGSGRGEIWGDFDGSAIKFEWFALGGNSGKGTWTVKPDSNDLIGTWHSNSAGEGDWNLKRIE
jgi:hypothetical protein